MSYYKITVQPSAKLINPVAGSSFVEPPSKKPFKVAIVDDQASVRGSWSKRINSFPDFACVCACSNGEEALRRFPHNQPDVVLMDIFLPRMSGIECTERLKALLPKIQIVMLTARKDQELVLLALGAGADGYLLKRTKSSDLRTALLNVLSGGVPMTNLIARQVLKSFRQKAKVQYQSAHFTVREEQILLLLTEGYSNKLIAVKLELSVDTVCTHLKSVFTKLHASSRTQAAVRYMATKTRHGSL